MTNHSEWHVDLAISGAITVKRRLKLDIEKRSSSHRKEPFWTTVQLSTARGGIDARVLVRAPSKEAANDSAVHFFGQMLDVLGLRLDTSLYLGLFSPEFRPLQDHVRRVVSEQEWVSAFDLGRQYGLTRRVFSRALSWYRKGMNAQDVIDQLLAFWSALEGIAAPFGSPVPPHKDGTVNKICACFDQLWGKCEEWKVIPGNPIVVNEFSNYRNKIAHGYMDVDIDQIREIRDKLPLYHQLTHAFLSDWQSKGLDPEPSSSQS